MSQYKYSIVDYFDSPEVLNTATTSIPASTSSTLTVVASITQDINKLHVQNGIGSTFIGIYKGASGSETLAGIVGVAGSYEMDVSIPASTRVSLRSMTTSAITSGELVILFLA
jgi:hypothetical protein